MAPTSMSVAAVIMRAITVSPFLSGSEERDSVVGAAASVSGSRSLGWATVFRIRLPLTPDKQS